MVNCQQNLRVLISCRKILLPEKMYFFSHEITKSKLLFVLNTDVI